MGWQPIETAPKDGTIVRLRNEVMREQNWTVRARWGKHKFMDFEPIDAWVSCWTETSDGLGFPAGRLIIPTEWRPDSPPPSSDPQGDGTPTKETGK